MYQIIKEIKTFFQRPGVQDLFELTYAYTIQNDRYFNRSLFGIYAWGNEQMHPEQLLIMTRERLTQDQCYLLELAEKVVAYQDRRAPILHKMLTYTHKIRSLIWRAAPFEIQKWHSHRKWLSKSDYDDCLQAVQQFDYELFWHPISQDTWEVSRSYCYLSKALEVYGDELSGEEQKIFSWYLHLVGSLKTCNRSLCMLDKSPSLLDDTRFDVLVSRSIYIHLFELAFTFYGINIPIIIDERSSIYDSHDALYLPIHESYDTLALRKVLELIAHEIETHYIVLHNTDRLLYGIKWGWSLTREEWLAVLQEYILNGYSLEDFDIRVNIPSLLMGELLDGTTYQTFLDIYRKLHGFIPKGTEYLLRRKRNYPLWGVGIWHKDVTYSRGLYHLRWWLLGAGSFNALFLAKVDMEDIICVENNLPSDTQSLLFPQLLAMRLVGYILLGKDRQATWMKKMQKKYKFLGTVPYAHFTFEQELVWKEICIVIDNILMAE